ncbi:MAG: hypothetical protein IT423_17040, partial [Pirellulaceae bacterium]|nr:hypothetical protein [Pirellulaceae bacterium]
MTSQLRWFCLTIVCATVICCPVRAAELIQLNEKNYDSLCPRGKEPDAIYGDWVLRNEHLTAVIAAPVAGRNANMTVRNVGGMLIDLTLRGVNSDQLSAFSLAGARYNFHDRSSGVVIADDRPAQPQTSTTRFEGRTLSVTLTGQPTKGSDTLAKVTYTLGDGHESIGYRVEIINQSAGQIELATQDLWRCDGTTFKFGTDDETRLLWAEDRFFHQAYGLLPDSGRYERSKDSRSLTLVDSATNPKIVEAGKSQVWSGQVLASQGLPGLRMVAAALRGQLPTQLYQLKLNAADGPVEHAEVEFSKQGTSIGVVHSDPEGWIRMRLSQGDYQLQIRPYARAP